ncbi:hypothetical protein DACRYDRAFT_113711 [Dacryopinax primogenitus]|uniref:Uncharacterized protein n=1 Tax=Dacryopinax primogenitus (strain DJM 731) TaxID=1858805 RepID=M5G5W4_DACPD|nr:uncharacterized protein DACRYDRAFT_113711 [Dacryopinax primogenitus]EJU05651.1 hypothetical protein DACRYDRAFT_113711 [Dacryopinax primogenitus]
MSVTVEIVPTADCVAMVGDANTFTSYSLSGNVVINYEKSLVRSLLPVLQPLFYTVISIDIFFEGHQDVLDRSGGLASTAICRIQQSLIPPGSLPVVLSPIVHTLGIPFELAVPSWLPPTWMGRDGITAYSLFCKVKATPHYSASDLLLPHSPSTIELGNIYPLSGGRSLKRARSIWCLGRSGHTKSTLRTIEAKPVSIAVGRFRTPQSQIDMQEECCALFPHTYYILEPKLRITPDMLSDAAQVKLLNSLVLHIGVPSFVGVQETKVPVYCAIKSTISKELLKERKFEVTKVSFNIQQVESYQTPMDPEFEANHPLPPAEEHPPNMPLMAQNIFTSLNACGLLPKSSNDARWERHCELSKHDVTHTFDHPLSQGHCKINLNIPIVQEETGEDTVTIWPDMESPYCQVHHCIYMSIDCQYVDDLGQLHTENLAGTVPLRFTAVATSRSVSPVSPSFSVRNIDCFQPRVQKDGSPTRPLPPVPAYGQIFDENGETRMADPLPKYEPRRSNSTRSTSSSSSSGLSSSSGCGPETPLTRYGKTSIGSCCAPMSVHTPPRRHHAMAIAV